MPESLFVGTTALGATTQCVVHYPEHGIVHKLIDGRTKASADLNPLATYIDIRMSIADQSLLQTVLDATGKHVTIRRSFWNGVGDGQGEIERQNICTFTYTDVTFVGWLQDGNGTYGARFATLANVARKWETLPGAVAA
jgi:hypothetical protein